MNIVEEIARMMDAEGAYGSAYDGTGPNARKIQPTTRQKYFRSKYELTATQILKRCLGMTPEEIRDELKAFELAGWMRLGLPDSEALRNAVEEKYQTEHTT